MHLTSFSGAHRKPSLPADATRKTLPSSAGKVWLVGAGPGAADLLTLKALSAIRQADIIFFDHLVSTEIRALFPEGVPALYVGKVKNRHSIAQHELSQLLVEQAQQGLQVCRIKGGDPFLFGRGGEELLVLRQAGVDAEVIPGITAAAGCSAGSGIPLTHRGFSQGCTLITAHGEHELALDWQALARLQHTLVVYMGLSRAAMVSQNLRAAGMADTTPVAVIENGCRENQRVLITDLAQLPDTVAREQVQSPALIMIGKVVDLAGSLRELDTLMPAPLQSLSA